MPKQREAPRYLRRLMYVAVVIESLVAIPQAAIIYMSKDAGSVSLISWIGYSVLSWIWLAYSISTRDKPVILYSILSLFSEAAIITGILIY